MRNKLLVFCSLATTLYAASPKQNLQFDLQNMQTELQIVFERMETQENLISVLRQEVENTLISTKGHSSVLSNRFSDLELSSKALSKDITTLRDHFNTTVKEVDRLSKEMDKQSKNIKQLEIAMKALIEAVSPEKKLETAGEYKVKAGDSLEKIAKEHGTTPKTIKELNHLQKDTIYVGQNLILP
jgi:LysM repeat protein